MKLELIRIKERHDATLGVLCIDDYPRLVTLENPWLGNQREISCIPVGKYNIERMISPRFGETFEVKRVKNRSHILFHRGNTVSDTKGCILVGMEFAPTVGASRIVRSRDAFEWFLRHLNDVDDAQLIISTAYSTGASAI